MISLDLEKPSVDWVSVGFQNPKSPLGPLPSGFDVGDLTSTTGCSDQAGFGLSGIKSVGSGGFRLAVDSLALIPR